MSDAPAAASPVRRLTAILFTDMVGYTALVQEDEAHARRLRDRWRTVLERAITQHGGRLLQTYGDGSLSVFDSAIAAVDCAVAIQRALRAPPEVPLRIGVHTGDIVYDRDGVFGDGVNVASRIQSLAAPGSVLISGKVYDEIKNQPALDAVSLGEFDLKNVRKPMEVFAVVAEGVRRPTRDMLGQRPRTQRRSVAVLPFVNMSNDVENEFFSDGITEELINALTRVNGLQVTARTSSFAFKGRNDDVREIAARLGVTTVLEGSVRKHRDRVRITAQLIDASNGYHLFSQTYDQRLDDIFEAQDAIAKAIVGAVHDQLAAPPRDMTLSAPRTDAAAHAAYLHGLQHMNRWTPEDLLEAITNFERSIQLDPTFSTAYAGLAGAHLVLASYGQVPAAEAYAKAEAAARKGISLDDRDGEPHATLGLVHLFRDWDFENAYAECQKAVGTSPGSARVRHANAVYIVATGDGEKAAEEMEVAVQLDPLSPLMWNALATMRLYTGRLDEAIRTHDKALELDPTFRAALDEKGWIFVIQGRLEEALRTFERSLQITGDPYKGLFSRGFVYARMGRTQDAKQALAMLHERAQQNPQLSLEMDFMLLHYALGEMDAAFRYFDALLERRSTEALFMPYNPLWAEIRSQPEFWETVKRHGMEAFARGDIHAVPPRHA